MFLKRAKKKAKGNGVCGALYGHVVSGRMGGPKTMNLIIELQISCRVKETGQTQLMCDTEPSEICTCVISRMGVV